MLDNRIGWVDEPAIFTQRDFNDLSEYSTSLPTGTTVGKQWKRDNNHHRTNHDWNLCTYVDIGSEDRIGIRWQKLLIAETVIVQALLEACGLGP